MALVSCAQGGSPAVTAPDLADFRKDRLIDVLGADDITAITRPTFETTGSAAGWLGPDAPVLVVPNGPRFWRAYPLAILIEHELVNDNVDGHDLAITYSPLTNAAVVFERTARSLTLEFGHSGKVYQSDLVMYDRQTKSLWLQQGGVAIAGQLKGESLRARPATVASFADFRIAYPDGEVLARPSGRSYATSPYAGYDSRAQPFDGFFRGTLDPRLPAMERVVGIEVGGVARAYPFDSLRARGNPAVVNEDGFVVFCGGSARSPLNSVDIASGRIVGASGVFDPRARGRTLHFETLHGSIVDRETRSTWGLLGRALAGPLKGTQLAIVPHVDAFWFAWAAFHPGTTIWAG